MNFQCGVIPGPPGAAALCSCPLFPPLVEAEAEAVPVQTGPHALHPADFTDPPLPSPPFQPRLKPVLTYGGTPGQLCRKTFIPSVCLAALFSCMINAISASRLSVIF